MATETLAGYLQKLKNPQVVDLTDNGTCSQCGACCSDILPVSRNEIRAIKRYVKKHNIKECKHVMPLKTPTMDLTCPFMDNDKKTEKCRIYEVRPEICRQFICAAWTKEQFRPDGQIRHAVSMREEIFGRR